MTEEFAIKEKEMKNKLEGFKDKEESME